MNNTSSNIAFLVNGSNKRQSDRDLLDCSPPQETLLETGVKSAAILLVLMLSLIGNSLVIKVIHRKRRMRNVPHYLIVNMAVADLLITLMNMPEAAKVEITGTNQWFSGPFALVVCKLLPFCQTVSVSCSIFTLVVISFDKYVAIVYPLKRIMTTKRLRLIIPLIWFASAVTATPQLIANNLVHDEDGSVWCLEEWPPPFDPEVAPKDYTIVTLLILYLLPLSLITVFYSGVFLTIWRRRVPGNRTTATFRLQQRSRQKAGSMFVAVVVCFALCWLTEQISFVLLYFVPDYLVCGPPDEVWFLSNFFGFANSALNPCIYFVLNQTYRRGLEEILCCKGHPSVLSDISRTVRSRSSCAQDISGRVVSMELSEFTDLPKTRFTQRNQGEICLVHFRSLPLD